MITDGQGRCLLVRKRLTKYFIQPEGKPEIGEASEAALIRELEGPYALCGYLSNSNQQSELYTDRRNRRSYLVYAGPGSAY